MRGGQCRPLITIQRSQPELSMARSAAKPFTLDGSGVKAQCKVTVMNKPISAITLNMTTKTLTISADKLNPTYVLKPTVEPADAVYSSLKWTTGNADVVTVTSTGKLTARKAGVATITVSANGVKAQCKVTVKNLLVKTITLNLTKKPLTITSSSPHPTWMLRPTVEPANAVNTGVKFTSSNTAVATVSTTGKVTAVAPGTATITVTAKDSSGVKAVCTVTVK